jgi:hypothetical protein
MKGMHYEKIENTARRADCADPVSILLEPSGGFFRGGG